MIQWTPLQVQGAWDSLFNACDQDTQETLLRRLDFLIERGNTAREPISKSLGKGLFELRAKNARALFYFGPNRTIIFVHGLIKKRMDIPKRDIEMALKIKDSPNTEREVAYALNFPNKT